MATHVDRLASASFYQLRRIRAIRRSLSTSMSIQLVNSFVASRIDYCNSLLAGLPACQLDRIQLVLNGAARIIYGRGKYDHITPILRDKLHWLRVPERIRFKCCLLTYKALNNQAPQYIANMCIKTSSSGRRSSLRSATHNILTVPRTKTKFGDRSFAVSGPSAWNRLPDSVKTATSVDVFKSRLKTHLFRESYALM